MATKRTLTIEIRHKLPLWSRMTSWSHVAKAGTKRQWRDYVERAMMVEGIVLRCDGAKQLRWPGEPIRKMDRVTIVQLIGVNPKTGRVGNKYDRANLISMTDKLVFDNLTHIGMIPNDDSNVMPDPDTQFERTGKPWHGVRVIFEYTAPVAAR